MFHQITQKRKDQKLSFEDLVIAKVSLNPQCCILSDVVPTIARCKVIFFSVKCTKCNLGCFHFLESTGNGRNLSAF